MEWPAVAAWLAMNSRAFTLESWSSLVGCASYGVFREPNSALIEAGLAGADGVANRPTALRRSRSSFAQLGQANSALERPRSTVILNLAVSWTVYFS
jgi:hypothetical protein